MKWMYLTLLSAQLGLFPESSESRTWLILPDGSGDAPTIQAGIDSAAAGDTVSADCGTYSESHIVMKSGIVVRSGLGDPDCATIDAGQEGAVFSCQSLDPTTSIEGFRITGGDLVGGMRISYSDLTVRNCLFDHNLSSDWGGAAACTGSSPVFIGCTFVSNQARWGGALSFRTSTALIRNCTFYGNEATDVGGGIYLEMSSHVTVENVVLAFNAGRGAIRCAPSFSTATLTCCDLYGNAGGDFDQCIAGQAGVAGNFSSDPLFCDPSGDDFHLQDDSPCVDAPGCGLVGAAGTGCVAITSVETEPPVQSWGKVKAGFEE